ncbi:MAG: hypothetical protein ACFE7E_07545 [Candidatus Hodarchaeota archaeon]
MSEEKVRTAGVYIITLLVMIGSAFIWFFDGVLLWGLVTEETWWFLFFILLPLIWFRFMWLGMMASVFPFIADPGFIATIGLTMVGWGIVTIIMAFIVLISMANWARILTIVTSIIGLIIATLGANIFLMLAELIIIVYFAASGGLFREPKYKEAEQKGVE